ncbi:MAG: hypothetical protein AAF958_00790 [Planctomycetota bacterium]
MGTFVNGLYIEEVAIARNGQTGSRETEGTRYVVRGPGADDAKTAANAVRQLMKNLFGVDEIDLTLFDITGEQATTDNASVVTMTRNFRLLDRASFSTTGGTLHRSQSITSISRTPAPGQTAVDYQGAIGVTQDSVEGVDITAPAFGWTKRTTVEELTVNELNTIIGLTGKVNGAAWRIWNKGEVLFLGAEGEETDLNHVDLVYHFAVKPNETNIPAGPITIPAKEGWHHLWIQHREEFIGDRVLTIPAVAYVEQVYPYGDFSLLDLGS